MGGGSNRAGEVVVKLLVGGHRRFRAVVYWMGAGPTFPALHEAHTEAIPMCSALPSCVPSNGSRCPLLYSSRPSLGGLCGPKARQCQLPHFNLSFFFLPLVPPHQAPGGGGHLLLKENDFPMGNGLDTKKNHLATFGLWQRGCFNSTVRGNLPIACFPFLFFAQHHFYCTCFAGFVFAYLPTPSPTHAPHSPPRLRALPCALLAPSCFVVNRLGKGIDGAVPAPWSLKYPRSHSSGDRLQGL